jgi:hypothetical protein
VPDVRCWAKSTNASITLFLHGQNRSHVQVVLPSPSHAPTGTDVVCVVRRMQCHYNPVWVGGRALTLLADLPPALRALAFPGVVL